MVEPVFFLLRVKQIQDWKVQEEIFYLICMWWGSHGNFLKFFSPQLCLLGLT